MITINGNTVEFIAEDRKNRVSVDISTIAGTRHARTIESAIKEDLDDIARLGNLADSINEDCDSLQKKLDAAQKEIDALKSGRRHELRERLVCAMVSNPEFMGSISLSSNAPRRILGAADMIIKAMEAEQ